MFHPCRRSLLPAGTEDRCWSWSLFWVEKSGRRLLNTLTLFSLWWKSATKIFIFVFLSNTSNLLNSLLFRWQLRWKIEVGLERLVAHCSLLERPVVHCCRLERPIVHPCLEPRAEIKKKYLLKRDSLPEEKKMKHSTKQKIKKWNKNWKNASADLYYLKDKYRSEPWSENVGPCCQI